MQEKFNELWRCGYTEVMILRGVVCWHVQLLIDKTDRATFSERKISTALDKAIHWANEHRRNGVIIKRNKNV